VFARKVAARLKPNTLKEFTDLMAGEILPWLRKQEGFRDLIVLAARDGMEVAAISFWDYEANAQAYQASGYQEALEILAQFLDGPPYVKTFDVVGSTFQSIILAPLTQKQENPAQETGASQSSYHSYETSV